MKTITRLCCLLALWSCNGPKSNTTGSAALVKQDSTVTPAAGQDPAQLPFISQLRKGDTLLKGKTYVDSLSFITYDDEGDDGLLFCLKGQDTVPLIFNTTNAPALNNGDRVLVQWNMDIYEPAGDPDSPYPREFVVDYRLLQPGKVTLLKKMKAVLEGTYADKDLTDRGKSEIDAAVWYYVANTTDTAIRRIIDVEQKPLKYSVEHDVEKSGLYGIIPIVFMNADQQVLKRAFFDVGKPYSLSE